MHPIKYVFSIILTNHVKITFFTFNINFHVFKRFYLFTFLVREEWMEKEGERNISVWERGGCLLHAPNWGTCPGPQPRPVPWLGTELVTFLFTGWWSIHWATLVRANFHIILKLCICNNFKTIKHFDPQFLHFHFKRYFSISLSTCNIFNVIIIIVLFAQVFY